MSKKKRNIRVKIKQNEKRLDHKIEIATQTLDRNINFITSCDNKTSVVLTAVGVLLTIILTNEGLIQIYDIIKSCIATKNFCNILYLICFILSGLTMLIGVFKLIGVLIARTKQNSITAGDTPSRIFFIGIKKSGDCNSYKEKFHEMSKEDLLNDLIEQIYINADIASIKYKNYNLGLKCMMIGFVLFIFFLLIGIYIY